MGSWAAIIAEFLGSLIAFFAIQSAMNRQRLEFFNPFLLISMGYGLGYLLSTGISGGSLNPARAIAPQLAAADLTGWWAYIIGPLAAAGILGFMAKRSAQPHIEAQPEISDQQRPPVVTAEPTPQEVIQPEVEQQHTSNRPDENIDEVQNQDSLQQKAQEALDKLKEAAPKRPHLPYASTKPSFYSFGSSNKEETTTGDVEATKLIDQDESEPASPTQPTEAPEAPAAKQPEVKFINYAHQSQEEEDV
jgi:hypothetical protein